MAECDVWAGLGGELAGPRARGGRSDLDLLVLDDAFGGGTREHAILERRVVLELSHRQLAAHAPSVEHEAIRIDHRILVAEPFPPRESLVDLLQVTMEGFESGFLERGKRGWI